ncbi:hypothetical protein CLV51_1021213 [Chitinophaga niastensis]|uniref:DUF3078 family protein n=2 Tax=Chitinophaga niastensis TaxID=536980 RepID=A0A2P8HQ65_CHINA|nr:hypothetical protein CLV51_1021213 [Chitinophaga niastensis]
MKYLLLACALLIFSITLEAQTLNAQLDPIKAQLERNGATPANVAIIQKTITNGVKDSLQANADLYNTIWKLFTNRAFEKDSGYKFLSDFNILFKTFQTTDNANASLGFSYDFSYDYANYVEKKKGRISNSFGISAKGNVAFKKSINPNDFLETKIDYRYAHFSGGVIAANDTAVFRSLNDLEDQLVIIQDMKSPAAQALWKTFGSQLNLTNQYYYAFSPKASLESNQDFSKTQFVPGIAIDLGAKAWNKHSTLAHLNVFDYPFALLRFITRADKNFTVYGSTIPTVQLSGDYVVPTKDSIRQKLAGNLSPYPRLKFETSFRTFITRVKKENIFFNADLRIYRELNAPKAIKGANLDAQTYFVMALQSTTGFYVSYANGRLPFDAKNDEVYAIGFNYKF